jgi:transcriptional regulator with PAS, ATPase and Fis domain
MQLRMRSNMAPLRPASQSEVVTANVQMQQLLASAARVAQNDAKVLITGESGAGKDVIARLIHGQSARRHREYVVVNCAGVADSLLESELFGHVKGSFTGAYRDKRGKLQVADGGTLFLDELGEMTMRMQGLLLRFLDSGEIQAVGADAARTSVNVRVIAATNRSLPEMVAAGTFRHDLYYRLHVVHLHVPPLRERREDLRALAASFLDRLGYATTLTDDAWSVLEKYPWPGNVRELRNVMEQLAMLATPGEPVTVDRLPSQFAHAGVALVPVYERRRQLGDELYKAIVEDGYRFWEHIHPMFLARDVTRHDIRELVRCGLRVTRGNYRGLISLLNIPDRDYKKFMNFLSTHDCRPDFREFRYPGADTGRAPIARFPELVPLRRATPTAPRTPVVG